MTDQSFPFHHESAALVNAPVDRVFACLDDPKALAGHMGESSMMMAGSRMSIDVDADGARVVGSKIRMQGRLMSMTNFLLSSDFRWPLLLPALLWLAGLLCYLREGIGVPTNKQTSA